MLADFRPHLIRIPAGERHKTLDSCRYIWEQLFAAGAGRNWCLLNLGGGVIGDMGGFCAGTFKRGMDFIQIPTTLLSQVDASVGGKLGIDFNDIKNSIGLFQDPVAVWADPAFFATLPPREVRSGFAEIIKHALIASAAQWERLQKITDLSAVDWVGWVADSVAIKRDIVEEDPHERGLRKALNFGHTIGHAIESYFLPTTTPLLHGEAIAAGMIAEAWLSYRQQGLPARELETITRYLLRIYGHQPVPEAAFAALITYMRQDKKNEDTRINFSLLPAPGTVAVNQTAEPGVITEALRYYNQAHTYS
jgi:3-dehydroquinate synthase